ncbi:MAG: DNA-binding Lrp family transcriptional regulator [Candidatus Woesearchaeota archaeon]|jgi:DNA-binding Lrp family transcriptional regulator
MDQKELVILSQFRQNARENLTTTSRKIRIPISTIYDRLRRYEGNVIKKYTTLLDFGKLGYNLKVQIVLKVALKSKAALQNFLNHHSRVNSLFLLSNDYDFLLEGIFRDIKEVSDFAQALEKFSIIDKHEFYVVDDIKREDFLTNSALYDLETFK